MTRLAWCGRSWWAGKCPCRVNRWPVLTTLPSWCRSLGGCIAVDVVTAYGPDYISGIIYVGGSVLALNYHPPCKHPLMDELWPVISSLSSDDMSVGAEAFVDSCVKTPLPFDVKLLWMGGFIMQPRAARYWSIRRTQDHTVWEATARRVPVLIVQGKEDVHCLYENMIGIARRIYDDVAVTLMDGVGHSPHFENAAETNSCIGEWAKRVVDRYRGGGKVRVLVLSLKLPRGVLTIPCAWYRFIGLSDMPACSIDVAASQVIGYESTCQDRASNTPSRPIA